MDWFSKNPSQNATFLQQSMWKSHVFGRQQFAKSYAKGGMAATIFAPTRKEMLASPWRKKHFEGSPEYIKRLGKLNRLHQNDPGIKKATTDVKKVGKPGKFGAVSGIAGIAMAGYLVAEPALASKGDVVDRTRALGKGASSYIGWEVGTAAGLKTGMGIGAAIGAAIGSYIPVAGTAVGAAVGAAVGSVVGSVVGGLAGSEAGGAAFDATLGIPDRMVERERARRGLNWGQHTAAFQTKNAATMRQQSLSLMNRGAMSTRSLMGQEATFVHR